MTLARSRSRSAFVAPGQLDLFAALSAALPDLLPRQTRQNAVAAGIFSPAEVAHVAPCYFHIDQTTLLGVGGVKAQLLANLQAIKTVKRLLRSGENPSALEQAQMVQYTGWGALSSLWDRTNFAIYKAVNDPAESMTYPDDSYARWGVTYGSVRTELDSLLSEDEIGQAEASTLNAFFTGYNLLGPIWQLVERLGFTGGRILEPAAGTGHFVGSMPAPIREKSSIVAVEKDPVTAQILSVLYPDAQTHNSPFEEVRLEDELPFDLVIGNVPFGSVSVYDSLNRDLSKFPIHNYFIGRSARLLREGGLLALITTSGTMDAAGSDFRQKLADERIELIGAVRLPSCAFTHALSGGTGGTQVTTDVLICRKQTETGRLFPDHTFLTTCQLATEADADNDEEVGRTIWTNEYFVERPHMMLGKMHFADEVGKGGLYRGDRQTLFLAEPGQLAGLWQGAIEALPSGIYQGDTRPGALATRGPLNRLAQFTGAVKIAGHIYSQKAIISQYESLKGLFREVLAYELSGTDAHTTETKRAELQAAYVNFIGQYGRLNRNARLSFLETWDAQFTTVQALENVHREGKTYRTTQAAILTERVYPLNPIPQTVETVADALQLSLYQHGRINTAYMSAKLGRAEDHVKSGLLAEGLVFVDPDNGKLIERSEYLSGHIRTKLNAVEAVLTEQPAFQTNYNALMAVLPPVVPVSIISFGFGSTWLPKEIIVDFFDKVLDQRVTLHWKPKNREYEINQTSYPSARALANSTKERSALQLVEAAVNNRSLVVTKTIYVNGESKPVRDPEATAAAVQKQEELLDLFIDFVRAHHAAIIETIYNDRFCGNVQKVYALPHYPIYPGANPALPLRKHQQLGVERIKAGDTGLAHSVGTGKTMTMITAVMELKRLGQAHKAIVAVQNSTVAGFAAEWKRLYPAALVYVPDAADLEPANRKRFMQRIATNNFDGIIIPKSFLKLIPDDPTDEEAFIQAEMEKMEERLEGMSRWSKQGKKTVKAINAAKQRIEARRKAQADRQRDNMLHFGQLGVKFLVLDEAHSYKRLGFTTRRRGIKGIDTQGSQDAWQAMTKCRTIQRNGGRVVWATGTPISNTMAEAWTMLRYLAPQALDRLGLGSFDEFAGTFGQIVPSFELTAAGQFKVVDRFAKFVNVGQLSAIYRTYVDVVLTEQVEEFKKDGVLPRLKNGAFTSEIIPQTPGVHAALTEIRAVLKWYEGLHGEEKKQNSHIPLVMFGQARKATLDIRLLDATNEDEPGSKTAVAVERVLRKYHETTTFKGTQLVFADLFQSPPVTERFLDEDQIIKNPAYGKRQFNLFEDIKGKLIAKGIPADQIAIVPEDAKKREPYFEKVRTGDIRILLGTSERMGVGVNVQDIAAGAHHLDAPNRPTDFEQRNGRVIRQCNQLAGWGIDVEVFTYGVDKTLDATAYGRMAVKQKFINQVLRGDISSDTMSDVNGEDDLLSMSFDEMMATLSGSTAAVQYTVKNHELSRLNSQRKNHQRAVLDAQGTVERAGRAIEKLNARMPQYVQEAEEIKTAFMGKGVETVVVKGEKLTEGYTGPVELMCRELKARAKAGKPLNYVLPVNGIPFTLTAELGSYVEGRATYDIHYSWGLTMNKAVQNAQGLFVSIRNSVPNVIVAPACALDSLAWNESLVREYSPKVTEPFRKQDEINRLQKEVKDLKDQMQAETAEAEAKA